MHNSIQQNGIIKFFRLFFPLNRKESVVFLCIFIIYFCIALYFSFFSSLIDHPTKETDLYFSLDNPLIFKYGKSHISAHPLTIIFYYPFVILGNFLAYFFGIKAKTMLFAILCASMISLSCLYIYRYTREIVELKNRESILITTFFAFFSTNLILCFTPETFSLATFFLSFSAYYYASHIKNKTKVSIFSSTLLASICLGGVTITNFVKGIIPLLFLKENITSIIKKVVIAGFAFLAILLLTEIAIQISDGRSFYDLLFAHQQKFTSRQYDNTGDYLKQIYSNFWGAPIFFSEIINNTYYSFSSQQTISMLNTGGYRFWWQYIYITLLTVSLICSIIKNYKSRFMHILVLLLSVDLVIHCVMRFGIDTPFIYGGHWVYTIPLIFAWLFKNIYNSNKKNIAIIFLFVMTIVLATNNIVRLIDFATIAKEMYPPIGY